MRRLALALAVLLAIAVANAADPAPPKKKAAPKPTVAQLQKQLDEQKATIEAQEKLIADQAAKLADQQAAQGAQAAASKAALDALQAELDAMKARLEQIEQQIPAIEAQKDLADRLAKIERSAQETPELVAAGDFPGSIRIPGTDAAIKFGGRIRTAGVFTLQALGSDDRFLTNSIPVETTEAGEGSRTRFTANTSRLNFELRTPTGAGYMRAFIEGDFYGSNFDDANVNFRLRHAFAQFRGFLLGQTWSTFSDPSNAPLDLDFEGINGENVVRQAQIRYSADISPILSVAGAAETPAVSITGGEGVNVVPDLVARITWKFKDIGHLQEAFVFREIRGEADAPLTASGSAIGWGAGISGVIPFRRFGLLDRFVFQINAGRGIARYINDLQSLGGQDAVFNPIDGTLHALPAVGFYLDYEHTWKEWERTRKMNLRSALIWSFVTVDNLDFQLPEAYHKTNRYSANIVFSPIERIDLGVQYLYGTRENLDGHKGSADQIQLVGIFRF
ncbi:MAG TPA: DcaP family trimeric outer membrane transporter [Candidatus Polarisedimenticolaceae bacterium]|nr:DcaP family trimeric outer membrane transporter [Candidatus Polarisedimenticolaceae bacterium]